jgi:hypothetical protein
VGYTLHGWIGTVYKVELAQRSPAHGIVLPGVGQIYNQDSTILISHLCTARTFQGDLYTCNLKIRIFFFTDYFMRIGF